MIQDVMDGFSVEMSARVTGLPAVSYGRSQEMLDALNFRELSASSKGIKFIDLERYEALGLFGHEAPREGKGGIGGVVVNVHKTMKSDPENIYIAISKGIQDSALVHLLAHVLDDLGGTKSVPGIAKPLSYELGIPTEHLEHPHEFGYWLDYLQRRFNTRLDADDTIISFLYHNGMLIKGEDIEKQDRLLLKTKSEGIMRFLSDRAVEIDALICECPGYIGSRVRKD